jgi:hypothetical protein
MIKRRDDRTKSAFMHLLTSPMRVYIQQILLLEVEFDANGTKRKWEISVGRLRSERSTRRNLALWCSPQALWKVAFCLWSTRRPREYYDDAVSGYFTNKPRMHLFRSEQWYPCLIGKIATDKKQFSAGDDPTQTVETGGGAPRLNLSESVGSAMMRSRASPGCDYLT